jgi:hypothetical protein
MAYHIITTSPDGSKIGLLPICRELIEENSEFKATFTEELPHLTRWTCEDLALSMLARVNVPNFAIRDKTSDQPDCLHHLFIFAAQCKFNGLCKKIDLLNGGFTPEHCKQCAFEERSNLRIPPRHSMMANLPDIMLIKCRSWSAYARYDVDFVCQVADWTGAVGPIPYGVYTIEINDAVYRVDPKHNNRVYQKMMYSDIAF